MARASTTWPTASTRSSKLCLRVQELVAQAKIHDDYCSSAGDETNQWRSDYAKIRQQTQSVTNPNQYRYVKKSLRIDILFYCARFCFVLATCWVYFICAPQDLLGSYTGKVALSTRVIISGSHDTETAAPTIGPLHINDEACILTHRRQVKRTRPKGGQVWPHPNFALTGVCFRFSLPQSSRR